MYTQLFDNQNNLILERHGQGIKLVVRDTEKTAKRQLTLNHILSLPFNTYFMDTLSNIHKINEATTVSFNLNSAADILGKTAHYVAKKKSADYALACDRLVVNTNKMTIKDESVTRLDGIKFPMLSVKFPWYHLNKLIGVFGFSVIVDKQWGISLAESISLIKDTGLLHAETVNIHKLPGLACGEYYFTQKEKEIILQLIRGKTARNIASMFGRSQRTIEKHIDNIKFKTSCKSKPELIEKILNMLA